MEGVNDAAVSAAAGLGGALGKRHHINDQRDFTAAQVAADYWDGAADQIAASREQFEALLHRNAALLGIREVNATQPLRWQAMQ